MLWLIYRDYLKQNVRVTSYAKFLNWYVWVIFSFMMLITGGLFICYLFYENSWLVILLLVSGFSGESYFGYELRKSAVKHIGTTEENYEHDINVLRIILNQRNVNSISQIEQLLNQIDDELPNLKVSENILKPFYTITTVILVPILSLFIKWLLDKDHNGFLIIIQIVALCSMIFSLFYMLKPIIEQIVDISFRRMSQLKRMLEDIKIIDFLK
ncbi:hypothetical protein EHV15_26570 [Paenibacillus oralis]|uniref:Uncharacterized protein n=1 Tax=Paenibacillus oralis TaxID=2490856 RepID=A0A3P3U941_9BACL|nr:hypothetical protein [Paenibacillus oralis]RRJ66079.1 hypothetical protein EHV15_26570 [Paenibacillus oralis]